jgi:hypothetical protein
MTNPPQYSITKPIFQGQRNAVLDCTLCDWSLAGPREVLGHAWNEHYRINHSQEIGVVNVHNHLRQTIWMPGR